SRAVGRGAAVPAVSAFDAGDAELEVAVPPGPPAFARGRVFGVVAPGHDRLFALPVGDGDAEAVGAAHRFHPEEAGLPARQFDHAPGGLGIPGLVGAGAGGAEDHRVVGRRRKRRERAGFHAGVVCGRAGILAASAARVEPPQPPSCASRRVVATKDSSRARAAPEAIASRARAMPSPMPSATPATYSAAPALSATISSGSPASPPSAPSSIALDSSGPDTCQLRLARIAMPKSSGWISYSRTTPSRSSPTRVAAPSEISSMPSRPHTTSARSVPSSLSTRTWMPTRSGWNTPISTLGAPAGLVSGPRMLK